MLKDATSELYELDPYSSVKINLKGHSKLPSASLIKPLAHSLEPYGLAKRMTFLCNKVIVEFQNTPNQMINTKNKNELEDYPEVDEFQCKTEPVKTILGWVGEQINNVFFVVFFMLLAKFPNPFSRPHCDFAEKAPNHQAQPNQKRAENDLKTQIRPPVQPRQKLPRV